MSVEKSLYKLLKDDAAVTAIVGTRIFPVRIPQVKDFPAISYMKIAIIPANQKDAVSGFDTVDFDVDCWAKSYSDVSDLSVKVRTALDRKSIDTEGSVIDTIVFVREFDGYDNEAMIYHKAMQFRFIVIR